MDCPATGLGCSVEFREFPHLCACSRTGFPRWTPGRFCVLAVSPLGHCQGLPCYGLEAWMRSGTPDCSCITNWSMKGWNAAQGSFKDTRQTCLGAAFKPVSSSLQKGGAGGGNLIKETAFACFSPLPRRQGWGWNITLFTCSFCFQWYDKRYLLCFYYINICTTPHLPSALSCSFSCASAWMGSPQWQRW